MKMEESYPNGWKTLREKEKLLVTSNFSFSHSVFKRLVLQTRKNQGLFGKGLKDFDPRPVVNRWWLSEEKSRRGVTVPHRQRQYFFLLQLVGRRAIFRLQNSATK